MPALLMQHELMVIRICKCLDEYFHVHQLCLKDTPECAQGAFSVAAKAGVPVVPVTLLGTGAKMPNGQEGKMFPGEVPWLIYTLPFIFILLILSFTIILAPWKVRWC